MALAESSFERGLSINGFTNSPNFRIVCHPEAF